MKKLLIILILFSLTGCGQQLGQEVGEASIADKYDAATEIKAEYQLDEAQLIKREIKNAELDKYKSEPKDEFTVTIGDKTDLLGGPA